MEFNAAIDRDDEEAHARIELTNIVIFKHTTHLIMKRRFSKI